MAAARKINSWEALSDARLLDVRLCDLGLRIDGSLLEDRLARLRGDLERCGLRFRPHFWLSTEWFTPDGNPGIAIPFYLAHSRLAGLERRMMGMVEGGTRASGLRILRHETGHAIQNAYRLHHRSYWRRTFGRNSQPYPTFYQPRPHSHSYVIHLDEWYAQSHPAEDFAETFAVWLTPGSRWRTRYRGWSALAKLEYVDALMREIADVSPTIRIRAAQDAVSGIRLTLRELYQEKRKRFGADQPQSYDRDLHRLFARTADPGNAPSAADFLRRARVDLRREAGRLTGQYQYTIDRVLTEMIARCETLQLHLNRPEDRLKQESVILLAVVAMNHVRAGRHRIPL